MNNPVIYIFLNKGLHMSSGKAAAQAAHAAVNVGGLCAEFSELWTDFAQRTIIVLELQDDNQMRNMRDYLDERGYTTFMIIDEGVNEIAPMSITALATEVLDKYDEEVMAIFKPFKLYKDKKHFWKRK